MKRYFNLIKTSVFYLMIAGFVLITPQLISARWVRNPSDDSAESFAWKFIAIFKETSLVTRREIKYSIFRWEESTTDGSKLVHFAAAHFDSILNSKISLVLLEEGEIAGIDIDVISVNAKSELDFEVFRYLSQEAVRRGIISISTAPLDEMSSRYKSRVLKEFLKEMERKELITELEFDRDHEGREYAKFKILGTKE